MATKRQYIKGVVLCAGTCKRYLRPSYQTAAEAEVPGTVRRHAKGMCKYCHRRTDPTPVKGDQKLIRPCQTCGHMTRPGKVKAELFPGTRIRVGELCRNCDSACATVSDDRARYVKGELDAYLRSRGRLQTTMKEAS